MDVIALELRLSKDGALVAVHDPEVDRTTDGSGAVADLTLAELRELDAGQGERVPVLEEVLDAVRVPLQAFVTDRATAAVLAELILRRDLTSRVEVASTREDVLAETARLVPGVRTALYADSPSAKPVPSWTGRWPPAPRASRWTSSGSAWRRWRRRTRPACA